MWYVARFGHILGLILVLVATNSALASSSHTSNDNGKHLHLGWFKGKLCKFINKHKHNGPLNKLEKFCRQPQSEPPPSECHQAENYLQSFSANQTCHFPFSNKCKRQDFRNFHSLHWAVWNNGVYSFTGLNTDVLKNIQLQHETVVMKVLVHDMDDIKIKNLKVSLNGFEGKPVNLNAVTWSGISKIKVEGENKNSKGKKENGDDLDDGYLVELSFHLENFIFRSNNSAADILRLSSSASFKVIPNKRILRSTNVTLTLQGINPASCPPPTPNPDPSPAPQPDPTPVPNPDPSPAPQPDPTPVPNPDPAPAPQPDPTPVPNPDPAPAPQPDPTPVPNPDPAPAPQPDPTPVPNPDPAPAPQPDPTPTPTPPPPPNPPLVSITATSVGALTGSNSIRVDFISDVSATFQCSLDGGAYADCDSPYQSQSLADGSHHFSVVGYNGGGSSAPAFYDWTVDTIAPIVSIDSVSPSSALTDLTQITIAFSANEIASFQCHIDSGAWEMCSSPYTQSNFIDGVHYFYVQAQDMVGNTSAVKSYSWTVKTKPPKVQITSVVPSANPSNLVARTYTFTGSQDTVSFVCSLDGGTDVTCNSPFTLLALSDGSHLFAVKAVDALGKKSTPDTDSFTIDTVAPTVAIISTLPSVSPTNSNSMQIGFSSDESSHFACSIDSAASNTCASPVLFSNLADGAHKVQIVATDDAGNMSAPAEYIWTVDTGAPVLTITSVSPAGSPINQTIITLAYSVNESATVICTLDGSSQDCSGGSVSYSNLSDGSHAISLTPRDFAGNTGSSATYTFNVDTRSPVVTITSVNPLDNPTSLTSITFNFTSDETSQFNCRLDGGSYSACQSPATYSGVSEGSHSFDVVGIDNAGNTSTSPAHYVWNVDTSLPTIQITSATPAATPTNSQGMTLTFVSNESSASFSCQLDSLTFVSCSSPMVYNGLADGSHTFKVYATDTAGNNSASSAVYSWTVDTIAPVTSITSTSVVESPTDQTNITISFSANEASTYQCRLDGGSFTTCSSPISYSGLSPGSHSFEVHATDSAGNRDNTGASFSWSITAPPLILSPIQITNITTNSAKLTWTSNHPSNTQGAFKISNGANYTFTTTDTGLVLTHTVTLTGLSPNTSYSAFGISNDGFYVVNTNVGNFRTLR